MQSFFLNPLRSGTPSRRCGNLECSGLNVATIDQRVEEIAASIISDKVNALPVRGPIWKLQPRTRIGLDHAPVRHRLNQVAEYAAARDVIQPAHDPSPIPRPSRRCCEGRADTSGPGSTMGREGSQS